MKKLGYLGVAVLAGLGQTAAGDDPRNQISTSDNKQLTLPEAAAETNPAPAIKTRSSLAADSQPTGKSNVVQLRPQVFNLSPKQGLSTQKLEAPKLQAGMAADPSKLANLKPNESALNALSDRDAKRTEAKVSNLQPVSQLKTQSKPDLKNIPSLDLSDNVGK